MKLADFFSGDREKFLKPTPPTGERSEWLDFCDLEVKGGSILVVDAQFVPSEPDGLLVTLTPGNYAVQAKVVNYGGDVRMARLRVLKSGVEPELAGKIGETWTDTAKTGICDFETFSKAWGTNDDAAYAVIEPFFDTDEEYGLAVFDAKQGAVMPFVNSGFGDGTFPVFELLTDGGRVGFEIEFIADKKRYLYSRTPFQKKCHLNEVEQRALNGEVEAQWELGKVYLEGGMVSKNSKIAVDWLAKAADNGHVEAAYSLGNFFQNGPIESRDYTKARGYYEKAATKGSASAINCLVAVYDDGCGVSVDPEKATAYCLQAAQAGLVEAQFQVGTRYETGKGVEKNLEEAVKWYRLAAEQGLSDAFYKLGLCYQIGVGVTKDEKEAVKFFMEGYKRGHGLSYYQLGCCFEAGIGVEPDFTKAAKCYQNAALGGVVVAKRILGMLFKQGKKPMVKNLPFALHWLRRAVAEGDAEAHYELGLLYETGEGVAVDKVEASKLYQKAVAGGFTKAEERLKPLLASLSVADRVAVLKS